MSTRECLACQNVVVFCILPVFAWSPDHRLVDSTPTATTVMQGKRIGSWTVVDLDSEKDSESHPKIAMRPLRNESEVSDNPNPTNEPSPPKPLLGRPARLPRKARKAAEDQQLPGSSTSDWQRVIVVIGEEPGQGARAPVEGFVRSRGQYGHTGRVGCGREHDPSLSRGLSSPKLLLTSILQGPSSAGRVGLIPGEQQSPRGEIGGPPSPP